MPGGRVPEIVPVGLDDRRGIKRFVTSHYRYYRDDPNWVAPLLIDHLERLNPRKNPYLAHSAAQPFIAVREGEIVGRITAHENTQHVAYHDEPVGFFGFFESVNDQAVADALFDAASDWLSKRDLETIRGPASFSVNGDPIGLLIDGFDSPPVVGMPYNPPYYATLVERAGFAKAQDLYAYSFPIDGDVPARIERIAHTALKDPRLSIRRPDMKRYREEVEHLKLIYNEALALNWGAVPMTDGEFEHFAKELKLAVDPQVTFIAEYDGQPVGLSMVFVDMNQALKSANGRLFPFGLLAILARRRSIHSARLPVLGVLEPYRSKGIDAAFYYKSMIAARKRGYRHAELSWILESNDRMTRILDHMGLSIYKTYRMYDRAISS